MPAPPNRSQQAGLLLVLAALAALALFRAL
jgi:hypothetical protein